VRLSTGGRHGLSVKIECGFWDYGSREWTHELRHLLGTNIHLKKKKREFTSEMFVHQDGLFNIMNRIGDWTSFWRPVFGFGAMFPDYS
jgi:hypothetical protein